MICTVCFDLGVSSATQMRNNFINLFLQKIFYLMLEYSWSFPWSIWSLHFHYSTLTRSVDSQLIPIKSEHKTTQLPMEALCHHIRNIIHKEFSCSKSRIIILPSNFSKFLDFIYSLSQILNYNSRCPLVSSFVLPTHHNTCIIVK